MDELNEYQIRMIFDIGQSLQTFAVSALMAGKLQSKTPTADAYKQVIEISPTEVKNTFEYVRELVR